MSVLRHACATRSGLTVQCGATAFAALGMVSVACALSAAGVVELAPPTRPAWTWGAILGCGAFAAASFVLIAEAFRHAEATTLAPFQYLEVVGATAAGFLVFSECPAGFAWVGVAIILGSGGYIVHREQQRDVRVPRRWRGGRSTNGRAADHRPRSAPT